jgi:hypothetical protein
MHLRRTLVVAAALGFCAGFPNAARSAAQAAASAKSSSGSSPSSQGTAQALNTPLDPRLELIRMIDGEFAKALQPLPKGKKGFTVEVGKPIDMQKVSDMNRLYGTAITQGETVQISSMVFGPHSIVFEINDGPKKHFHFRDHIQLGMGDNPPPLSTDSHPGEGAGSTLILEYHHPVPRDLTAEDLKHDLAIIFDFSHQKSATVNWVDTLPPEFQKAIEDHHAVVGMDQDTVVAALGRPDHKVRQRDDDGNETEDWIYGDPPARTVFVTFSGDKVTKVEEFN